MSISNLKERRQYIRLDTVMPVIVTPAADSPQISLKKYQGFTSNISRDGLCLEIIDIDGTFEACLDQNIDLILSINAPFHKAVSAKAKISWRKSSAEQELRKHILGLHYLSISPGDSRLLVRYAKHRKWQPFFIGFEIILLVMTVVSLSIYGTSVEKKRDVIQRNLKDTLSAKNMLISQLDVLKTERQFQQSALKQLIIQSDFLKNKIEELSSQRMPTREMGYKTSHEQEKLSVMLDNAQREINTLKNYLSMIKQDKEALETRLSLYEKQGLQNAQIPALSTAVPQKNFGVVESPSLISTVISTSLSAEVSESTNPLRANALAQLLVLPDKILSAAHIKNAPGCALGAFVDPSTPVDDIYGGYERMIGKKCAFFMWFEDWSSEFPAETCEKIAKRGCTPMITWEPTHWNGKEILLKDIFSGSYDRYITEWAGRCAAWGKPVFIRFAHEFNGNWYPWSIVNNQKKPELYVSAYKKVVDTFRSQGAKNARFIWSINCESIPGSPWNDFINCYPGDGYVDWIGIDGYNWGHGGAWSRWKTFKGIFLPAYNRLSKAFPNKPLMISETGCAEIGGSKSQWFESLLDDIKSMPGIQALCWFNAVKERNWCIESSKESVITAQKVLSDSYFVSELPDSGD